MAAEKATQLLNDDWTTTPVTRTGVCLHMPLARPVCHTWFATVRPVCLPWLYGCSMHYRFSLLGLGGQVWWTLVKGLAPKARDRLRSQAEILQNGGETAAGGLRQVWQHQIWPSMTLRGQRSTSKSFDSKYLENGHRYEVGFQGALTCRTHRHRQIWTWMTLRGQKSRSYFSRIIRPERQQLRCWTQPNGDYYALCLKKVSTFKLSVTMSSFNQFSKCLHCWKAYEICSKSIPHYPSHLRHVATLPWEIKNSNFLQIYSRCRRKYK